MICCTTFSASSLNAFLFNSSCSRGIGANAANTGRERPDEFMPVEPLELRADAGLGDVVAVSDLICALGLEPTRGVTGLEPGRGVEGCEVGRETGGLGVCWGAFSLRTAITLLPVCDEGLLLRDRSLGRRD
mmetsp:Transcript_140549/g.365709  ORF Transcript_140549/g.365709 Transcript_140549/m.365709 type:complete len:131 (+) Transcript_140549:2280-2672(+)